MYGTVRLPGTSTGFFFHWDSMTSLQFWARFLREPESVLEVHLGRLHLLLGGTTDRTSIRT